MTPSLDRWTRGWRGPALAALAALIAILPGLFALPLTDRTEARLAAASAQMLDDGDFTTAAVDDQASDRRPLGLHWLQAASAFIAMPDDDDRRVWAYRLPALAGAMIAAAACAWGGAALLGSQAGFLAGLMLGTSFLVSTAGVIDAAGALAAGGVTLAVAALGRLRLAAEGELAAGRRTRLMLWLGLALSAMAEGLAGPAVVALAGLGLWLIERRARWFAGLAWGWGPIVLAAVAGPPLIAAIVASGPGGQAQPLLAHGGLRVPGFQLLLAPAMLFPFALLLPGALAAGRDGRRALAGRLALCWLVPAWLALEFWRGPVTGGGLFFYGAVCWLAALAARNGIGRRAARLGVALQALAALLWIGALLWAARRFGDAGALAWVIAAAIPIAGAAVVGGLLLLRGKADAAVMAAAALGVLAHGAVLAGVGPRLQALWVSQRLAAALDNAGLDPRAGAVPGPIALSGFGEPSLTFALGGVTEALSPEDAAQAVKRGQPAVVEAREEAAFVKALGPGGGRRAGEVDGFDYAKGRGVKLALWGPGGRAR